MVLNYGDLLFFLKKNCISSRMNGMEGYTKAFMIVEIFDLVCEFYSTSLN